MNLKKWWSTIEKSLPTSNKKMKISKEGIKSNNQPPKVNISGKNLVSNLEIAELISSFP